MSASKEIYDFDITLTATCPHCNREIQVKPDKGRISAFSITSETGSYAAFEFIDCPFCGKGIDFILKDTE
jgi:hypothetical protein